MELIKRIKDRSPEYDSQFEDFIIRFTTLQGGKAGTTKEETVSEQGKYFHTKYEIYMYAFLLGLRNNCRVPFPAKIKKNKFIEIRSWNTEKVPDYIVMSAIVKSEIDLLELEKKEESEVENEITKIKGVIEEYANGGFLILKEKYDNSPEFFANNENCFIDLLQKIS